MIQYELFNPSDHWDWVKAEVGCVICEDTQGLIARREEGGAIVGAALADSWAPNSCQAHIYVDSPIVLRTLAPMFFRHVFQEAGRELVFGLTPADNTKAVKLAEHLGFKRAAVLEDGYAPGVDYIISRMSANECRYINHGR